MNNIDLKFKMFCVYHKIYNLREDNQYFTFFGVNEVYEKKKEKNNILEYELDIYNPFLQKRGYMETSAYLHVYWNKLYKNNDMIGFSQYDMKHNRLYNNLDKKTIYLLSTNKVIIKDGVWNPLMFPKLRNLDFLIESYNKHFNKNYSKIELENKILSLWQTNIYPVKIYEKLCSWLEKLVDEIYPWCNQPPYETHFGSIGGYTERAISIFNAYEIYEGVSYSNLDIVHGIDSCEKEQYNKKSFLNYHCNDIYTKYIDNITGDYDVRFCMFKAECYLNNIKYNCERINKNKKNGLYLTRSDNKNVIEKGFDIEAEDPRLIILNNKIYIIFICLSPYIGQKRCIGITLFDEWKPIFLQIENMNHVSHEKNWAPFVKDNELYFVYNYDPLIIIYYNFNKDGICNIIFKQNNVSLPLIRRNDGQMFTKLRGGSNLLFYEKNYYIGGCHSRVIDNNIIYHNTHIVILDVKEWKLLYLSKPIMYNYNEKNLKTFHTILIENGVHHEKNNNVIQDPISLYKNKEEYFITINVRDCFTLLYKISFSNLLNNINYNIKDIGYWDNLTQRYNIENSFY